jgi:uroporphyrinogen-III synthase
VNVWVTRDEGPGGPLAAALREARLGVIVEPVIERQVVSDCRCEIMALGADDWLVLTSAFAIEAVAGELARVPRVAVVGELSAQAAAAHGLRVMLISATGEREGLFAALFPLARGRVVCYPRSSLAQPPAAPPDVTLISPVLYDTRQRAFRPEVADEADLIAVASPSAVHAILERVRPQRPFASIGPSTSRALRAAGIEPAIEAAQPTFASLAAAIAAARSSHRG